MILKMCSASLANGQRLSDPSRKSAFRALIFQAFCQLLPAPDTRQVQVDARMGQLLDPFQAFRLPAIG